MYHKKQKREKQKSVRVPCVPLRRFAVRIDESAPGSLALVDALSKAVQVNRVEAGHYLAYGKQEAVCALTDGNPAVLKCEVTG